MLRGSSSHTPPFLCSPTWIIHEYKNRFIQHPHQLNRPLENTDIEMEARNSIVIASSLITGGCTMVANQNPSGWLLIVCGMWVWKRG
jgi:hypothetical protein